MSRRPSEILGILGGMGPAATAEFLRLLSVFAPAEKDQDHPRVYLLSDPWIPDRTEAIIGNGPDPGPRILEDFKKLAEWGASLLAVPCNTAHVFIDKLMGEVPLPLKHAKERGYPLKIPGEGQREKIHETVRLVKANETQRAGKLLGEIVKTLRDSQNLPFIAACTELPLAWEAGGLPADWMISSLHALALSCIRRLYGGDGAAPTA
ncbi:MAG: Aspartate racemase [Synergistales bacterium 53_16]|nr:MAG: Aspartate racemase [Synergistales bacterium 53_16]